MLVTKNLTPGTAVYGEKRISVDGPAAEDGTVTKQEYRVWNPFRSKVNSPSILHLQIHGIAGNYFEYRSESSHVALLAIPCMPAAHSTLLIFFFLPLYSWLLVSSVVLMIFT